MKKYLKPTIYILLFFLLSLVVLNLVYKVVSVSDTNVLSKSEEYRAEIETGPKKWLNGYLGPFFRFKSIGNINWLILPLALGFLLIGGRKKLKPAHKALVFTWALSTIFICATGYANSRYQLTLFPFTAFMVIFLMWELLKDKPRPVKFLAFGLLTGLCIYNIVYFVDSYRLFWDLKVTRTTAHFPQKMIDYFNSDNFKVKGRSQIYVFNMPFYYYYTQKRGADYMHPNHINVFLQLTHKETDRQKMYDIIHTRNHIKYILVGVATLSQYRDRMITEFLNLECYPPLLDSGYKLYEIHEKSLEKRLRNRVYHKLNTVELFNLETQGIRGTFKLDKDENKKTLTVSNLTANEKGVRLIQLGFDSLNPASGMPVPPGKYIHFLVDAALPAHLVNRNNFVFIRDFKEKWESTTSYVISHLKRTYLISRQIRPGSTRVILGIRFTPASPADHLVLSNIRGFYSDQPL